MEQISEQTTQDEVLATLKENFFYLATEYGLKKIGVFGSYAKNTQVKSSDVDILVEFEKPIGLRFVEFCDFLEHILGKNVDVLTTTGMNSIRVKKVANDIEKNIIYV